MSWVRICAQRMAVRISSVFPHNIPATTLNYATTNSFGIIYSIFKIIRINLTLDTCNETLLLVKTATYSVTCVLSRYIQSFYRSVLIRLPGVRFEKHVVTFSAEIAAILSFPYVTQRHWVSTMKWATRIFRSVQFIISFPSQSTLISDVETALLSGTTRQARCNPYRNKQSFHVRSLQILIFKFA